VTKILRKSDKYWKHKIKIYTVTDNMLCTILNESFKLDSSLIHLEWSKWQQLLGWKIR